VTFWILLLALAPGCGDDSSSADSALLIRQNQVPQAGCVITTSLAHRRDRGVLDISVGLGYWLYPLLENTSGDPLLLRGYEVEIDLGKIPGSVPKDLASFYEPTTGTIAPGARSYGQFKVIPDRLVKLMNIPASLGKALVKVSVRALAKQNGADLESPRIVFPVDLCNGCLVDLRTKCPDPTDKTIKKNPCGTAQDHEITCCLKAGSLTCFKS